MKIQTSRSELLGAITSVSKAIASRHTIPSMTMALLQPLEGKLLVAGTNAGLTITKIIECNIKGDKQSVCIPPDMLKNLLAGLNVDEVALDVTGDNVVVKAKGIRATIRCLPPEDYPLLPVAHTKLFDISDQLLENLQSLFVPFCADRDIAHPWLQGVLLECKDNTLRIKSGNGYRYSLSEEPFEHGDFMVVVDAKAISEYESGMSLWLNEGGTQVIAKSDDAMIASTLYEPNFADLESHLRADSEETTNYTVNATELLSAIRLASTVIDKQFPRVQFDMSKDGLAVRVPKTQLGDFEQKIECEFSGKPLSIGFNNQYVSKFLSAVGDKEVHFNCVDPEGNNPVVLVSIDGFDGFTHFIMPVRLIGNG